MSMQIWNENGEQKLQSLVSRWVVDVSFRRDQAPGKWTNRMRIAENPGVLCISRGDKATTSFLILIVHPSTRKECYISQGLQAATSQLNKVAESTGPKRPRAVPHTYSIKGVTIFLYAIICDLHLATVAAECRPYGVDVRQINAATVTGGWKEGWLRQHRAASQPTN